MYLLGVLKTLKFLITAKSDTCCLGQLALLWNTCHGKSREELIYSPPETTKKVNKIYETMVFKIMKIRQIRTVVPQR